jgi:hypothetical protein
MSTDKIYLGTIGNDKIYLSKHSWDCNWYWSFGYIGNKNLHFHIESLINYRYMKDCSIPLAKKVTSSNFTNIDTIFSETWLTQANWWILRDLFIQAYALKKVAELYRYGGHQTTKLGITDIIRNEVMESFINKDLKTVLDTIWNYLLSIKKDN